MSAAALRRYSPEIVQLVDQLAAELFAAREPVRLVDRMRRFAFAVIASVVLGLEGGDFEARLASVWLSSHPTTGCCGAAVAEPLIWMPAS